MNPRSPGMNRITALFLVAAAVSACSGEDDKNPPRVPTTSTGPGGTGGGGGAPPAGCTNGVKDGDETDVDCGGSCAPCTDGLACGAGTDCASMSCENGVCLPSSCSDGVQNGIETDVDCGGLCTGCEPGESCADANDCLQQVCQNSVCLPPSCSDGVRNGTESDIDCGGDACSTRCPPGQKCMSASDCRPNDVCDAQTKTCQCPAGMVIAPVGGGGSYCIDAYEVTKQEYDVFFQANPTLAGLPPICAGNIYAPSAGFPYAEGRVPVTHVDWCDAYAYCKYSGKHLCGKVGGGSNAVGDHADVTRSEWYNACTRQGQNAYPYGNDYDATKYTGMPDPGGSGLHVKPGPQDGPPTCEGGVTGLYEMSANVAEWEDSCDASGQCRVRGGSVQSFPMDLRCDASDFRAALDNTDPFVGFRCCK